VLAPRQVEKLKSYAKKYGERGLAVCPLILDEDGIAKKPLSDQYPRFKASHNTRHDWSAAQGLGIVLGRPSNNLAVVDVDDLGLSDFLRSRLSEQNHPPLMAETARGRLHVYCVEPTPSRPTDLEVNYSGRRCLVQLLAAACQVAAPPTAGYAWIDVGLQPAYGTVAEVWRRLALEFNLPYREARPWSFLRRERSRGPTTGQLRESLQ
jgi:hypothetical protein